MLGTTSLAGQRVQISAEAPLSEVQDYATNLTAITGGSGSWSMQLDHYDPVPPRTQQDLIAAARPAEAG